MPYYALSVVDGKKILTPLLTPMPDKAILLCTLLAEKEGGQKP